MAFVRWFRSHSVDVQVAMVAVLGVVCLVAWPVAMVAAITVIGLPIAIVMAAFPTFALVIVAWRLSYRALAAAGLRDIVRLDLGVGPLVAQASAGRTLCDAIATGQPLPVAAADLSNDVFAWFVQQRKVLLADAEIAMAILRDRRLPVSQNAWALVRHGQDLPDQMKREVAELLFARLRDLAAAPDRSPRALQAAGPIGTAIDELPEWIVRIHRGDLEWLAQEPSLRGPASSALRQLSVFGAEAVPTLVSLVDVGASLRGDGKKPAKDWQPSYLAGLIGLCRAGSSAAVAIPALIERIGRGDIFASYSYDRRLTLQTLIRLGSPPAVAEAAFLSAGAPPEDIQRDLKQAQQRPKCTY